MNDKQQKILNSLLKFKEQDFFCSYDEGNHDYNTTGDIINLIVAGAKPTDYNIYKNVLQVAEEMEGTGMSPFFHAKSSIKQYVSSIIQKAPEYIQYDLYNAMIGEVQV